MEKINVPLLLQALEKQYPAAFKQNYLFYGQIKTKGIWDDRREFIPWVLGLMIFVPSALALRDLLLHTLLSNTFLAQAYAILAVMLFLMLVNPLIIKQIRHSSHSLYQLLQHSPVKLTIIIVLEAINLIFLQNTFVMWVGLLLAINFGFVRFYKENLFREQAQDQDYYQLQQLRCACFWTYKQTLKLRMQLIFMSKESLKYRNAKQQLNRFADLYRQLFATEHQYCKKIKHINIDTYLDEML
ncbi:hypothetical protein A3K93_08545 [Acinetobacter sp. NCu2D-2]|uniref:hypothetical protein n=1 Tax=Acinetobacter sp. NCu2D-2 TaxID=1608473 RepID=UPI0007CDE247|nr:hypothetical protein [Acinetobacter sp. NCu2D-2]ANF83147.1 hypothetical protein A3K93_08545 [Acinetobacter sp. NCu2D-2]